MPIYTNVNGRIKELYRIFYNDNGVIREYETFHTQNDNNEIKEVFVRNSVMPKEISWVACDDGISVINSVTNNGYTVNGHFSEHVRSASTSNKVYLPAGTEIRFNFKNIVHDAGSKPPNAYDSLDIYLFKDESNTPSQSAADLMNNELTVSKSGDYYIAFALCYKGAGPDNDNIYYVTCDVDITIVPPT